MARRRKKTRQPERKTAPRRKPKQKPRSPRTAASKPRTIVSIKPPKLKILFVASECAPFAKTGGLGDVVAGLSKALRRLGHDARIVLPLYSSIDRAKYGLKLEAAGCAHMGGGEESWFGVFSGTLDKEVPVWFVDYQRFFGRAGIYNEPWGEYTDNAFRFAMFSKATTQICKDRAWIPDVMHVHDWPTSLAAVFLKTWDRVLSPLSNTASVLTIHNVGYQGTYHAGAFSYIGVGMEHYTPEKFEDHGKINLLKAGIHFADALTTVSPTHAKELLDPIGGMGLAPHLNNRRSDLFGILNGADYEHWNPEHDPLIPARYSANDLSGKAKCKAALQERMFLERRADLPVFGIVSRFAQQKGFDLLAKALPSALDGMALQVAVLGSGDSHTEDFFRWLQTAYPGRVGAVVGFNNELSHCVEAGSDFFLMPSLYEPCGLNQMYSMKYGTLPVVRATGGLDDTVENYDENTGNGTGFKFVEASPSALHNTIGWAVSTWFDRPHHIAQLQKQAMAQEFSWNDSAQRYVDVYMHALTKKRAQIG
ncbi:MAG: glycogen synthase GlgA [Verrucomicrobiae bacterium]|nr:glycogen synthase GlgA [Verrucomicrobiae bacterium]